MKILIRSFFAAVFLSVTMLAQAPLDIVGAYFGGGNNFADVTARVRSMVQGAGLNVRANAASLGVDPRPGPPKVLRIYYLQNGQFNQGEWREGTVAQVGFGGRPNDRRDGGDDRRDGGAGDRRDTGGDRRGRILPLRIERALYGANGQVRDVTALLQSRVVNSHLELPVSNEALGGDPAPNQVKQLQLTYEWSGRQFDITANEHDLLQLPDGVAPGAAPARLRIISARYGFNNRVMDVTNLVQSRVQGDSLSLPVNNGSMGGDPAQGADKTLIVVYEINGERGERRANEGQQLNLP